LHVGLLSADFLFEPLEPLGSAYIGKLLQVGEKRELAASESAICRVCSAQLGSHRTETHVLHSSMHTSPHMPVDGNRRFAGSFNGSGTKRHSSTKVCANVCTTWQCCSPTVTL
jgi:hypothetical protein